MRSVDLPTVFHSETFDVGGSRGSSCWPKHDSGNSVAAAMIAAPVKKRPAITGVSSDKEARGRFGLTDLRGAVLSFLTADFSFAAGDSALAADFSLSLMQAA